MLLSLLQVVPLDVDFRISEWKDLPLRKVLRTLLLRTHTIIENSHPDVCAVLLPLKEHFYSGLSDVIRGSVPHETTIQKRSYLLGYLITNFRKP